MFTTSCVAAHYLRHERPDHTLQATALVHEAYLQLLDMREIEWRNRSHFIGMAAQMMRRVLVDHARKRDADKRGGSASKISLSRADRLPAKLDVDLVALDLALDVFKSSFLRQPLAPTEGEKTQTLAVAQEFEGYKILNLIAEGGMGGVYLAEDTALNRKVALKLIKDMKSKEALSTDPTPASPTGSRKKSQNARRLWSSRDPVSGTQQIYRKRVPSTDHFTANTCNCRHPSSDQLSERSPLLLSLSMRFLLRDSD